MKFGTYAFPVFCMNQWKITFLSQLPLNFSVFAQSNTLHDSSGMNFFQLMEKFYEYGSRFVKIDPLSAD